MKTFIEWDASAGKYQDKLAVLKAVLGDGTVLGSTELNLAEFAKPDKYMKNMILSNCAPGVNKQSFVIVEVKTTDANKDTSPSKTNTLSAKLGKGQVNFAPNSQTNKQLTIMQQQVDKLTKENTERTNENDNLRKELEGMGVDIQDQIKDSLQSQLAVKMQKSMSGGKLLKDNTEKYKKMVGITQTDITQLLKLDKETERLFEV